MASEENIDKRAEGLAKGIERLDKIIENLSTKNQIAYNAVLKDVGIITAKYEGQFSKSTETAVSMIDEITTKNRTSSKKEQKESLKEIGIIQNLLKEEQNQEIKNALVEQVDLLEQSVSDNTKLGARITDSLVNNLDNIAGIMAGVAADSPILAIATKFGIEKIQEKIQGKKDLLEKERQLHEEQQKVYFAEAISAQEELMERITDPEIEDEASDQMIEKLNAINESIGQLSDNVEPLTQVDEETKREQATFNDQLLDALSKDGEISEGKAEKDSGGLTNILGFLGVSAFFGGLKKSIMSGLKTMLLFIPKFFKGLGKLMLKAITKVFLPIAIIASLFSGIKEAIDVYSKTGSIMEAVTGFFGGIFDFITFGLFGTEKLNALIDWLGEKGQMIWDAIPGAFQEVSDYVTGLFKTDGVQDALSFLGGMWDKFLYPFTWLGDKLGSLADTMKSAVYGLIADIIPDWAKSFVPDSFMETINANAATSNVEPTTTATVSNSGQQLKVAAATNTQLRNDAQIARESVSQASNQLFANTDNSVRTVNNIVPQQNPINTFRPIVP